MNACPLTFSHRTGQSGMSLVEVLVSLLVLSVGLMGAAVIQLNALRYTDSSRMTSQASFIAYDMLDRIRANAGADYAWQRSRRSLPAASTGSVRDQDLHDFDANITGFAGEEAEGSIAVSRQEVTIRISWDDSRGAKVQGAKQTFTLTSRVAVDPVVLP